MERGAEWMDRGAELRAEGAEWMERGAEWRPGAEWTEEKLKERGAELRCQPYIQLIAPVWTNDTHYSALLY